MKATTVSLGVFVLLATGCGYEAADARDVSHEVAAAFSSGAEPTEHTIVRLETRHGIVDIRSAREGVRYGVAGSTDRSIDQLRTEHPQLYEVLQNATASPLHGIDARVDTGLLQPGDSNPR